MPHCCLRALVAQEEKPINAGDLAKAAQNPVASLISIPFQFNFNSGGGLGAGTLFNLNVQPVIPIKVTKDWNVIFRTIIPFLSSPTPSGDQVSGIGDIQLQFFASPAHPGKIIWGVGPIFSVPAATNPLFRTGSWAVGPNGGRPDHAGALGARHPGQPVVDVRRIRRCPGREPAADPAVRQLQLREGLGHLLRSDHHGELERHRGSSGPFRSAGAFPRRPSSTGAP